MNFENEKYEYLLHTWGGFYNPEHKEKHGLEEGYLFFDTMEELKNHLAKLRKIEDELGAKYLVSSISQGTHVRYRTIAKMKLVYEGTPYNYEYDFGFGYPADSAIYMFEEGNYSCDCNRSIFLNQTYGNLIEIKDCGNSIKMTDFEILQIKEV